MTTAQLDYKDAHPMTALLVVEVSDSSLHFDRTHKARTYAATGISEYWILNLVGRQLEVHRGPVPTGYQDITVLGARDVVTPLAAPQARIAVADLLP